MTDENRHVHDLDDDRKVWISDSITNRNVAHLDENCHHTKPSAQPRTPAVLHQGLRICKRCDPDYEISRRTRAEGEALAHRIRAGETTTEQTEQTGQTEYTEGTQ